MFKETNLRTVIKTISWRLLATITTMILVYLFTEDIKKAVAIGILEVFLKLLFYYVHERGWNLINFGKKTIVPKVIWLTGLSGSGKSTIAEALFQEMKEKGLKVELLDGDKIREIFPKTGFSKQDRNSHIKRVGYLASKLEENGIFVIAAFISPYKSSRDFIKDLCKNFVEIHVSTSLKVCEKRDVKGLYAKVRSGEIKNFTGINDPYENPENPDIIIDTNNQL